ncbi:hypothetical protein ACFVVA_41785, partial [Kitasatospora sp. NPDC058048]|uniref:hypothetical protein n=1 Tax=Kitasatospora sp. NPDC058048 TaxID=3346313 RepID=UPI0036D7F182
MTTTQDPAPAAEGTDRAEQNLTEALTHVIGEVSGVRAGSIHLYASAVAAFQQAGAGLLGRRSI